MTWLWGGVSVFFLVFFGFVWGEGVDHFDVEQGALERWVVELADVVEEVAGERAVRVDSGAGEAEVGVVFGDLLVERLIVEGDGGKRKGKRNLAAFDALHGEEAALDVVEGGGGDDVVVDGDELDAGIVEREGSVAVVSEDDADGDETVLDVGETEEVAVFGVVARVGGDGEVFAGVGVEGGILAGGVGWGGFFVGGKGVCRE